MASLFEENLHSSDSDDDDYVPDGEVSSEDDEDPLPPEQGNEIKTKKNLKKKGGKVLDTEGEKNKIIEEKPSSVDEKQRANDLFKSFLEEVEAEMKVKEPDISPLDALKTPDSDVQSNQTPETPSSCELFEFAGETVLVGNDGTPSSEKSSGSEFEKNASFDSDVSGKSSSSLPVAKPRGLQSVLNTIMNKKSKLTTLQKTSIDWSRFKREHGIAKEIETFNKGRGGYLERKRFLERSDLRSYEVERDMRMTKRKKNS